MCLCWLGGLGLGNGVEWGGDGKGVYIAFPEIVDAQEECVVRCCLHCSSCGCNREENDMSHNSAWFAWMCQEDDERGWMNGIVARLKDIL